MTVEELIKVLNKEVTFEVYGAYDVECLFDSTKHINEFEECWESVRNKKVYEFYPTDIGMLRIYVFQDWLQS